jgi:plasmid maintenance system antidote protein VapI
VGNATPDQLRELLTRIGISQREAARRLDVREREFRRMCAGQTHIPAVIMLALQQLAQGVER